MKANRYGPAKNWDDVAEALLRGAVIRIPEMTSPNVTGRLSGRKGIRGLYTVRVNATPEGVVTWLDTKRTTKGKRDKTS